LQRRRQRSYGAAARIDEMLSMEQSACGHFQ
jgi:hypothetical protein